MLATVKVWRQQKLVEAMMIYDTAADGGHVRSWIGMMKENHKKNAGQIRAAQLQIGGFGLPQTPKQGSANHYHQFCYTKVVFTEALNPKLLLLTRSFKPGRPSLSG